jgi:hypothetical protein
LFSLQFGLEPFSLLLWGLGRVTLKISKQGDHLANFKDPPDRAMWKQNRFHIYILVNLGKIELICINILDFSLPVTCHCIFTPVGIRVWPV